MESSKVFADRSIIFVAPACPQPPPDARRYHFKRGRHVRFRDPGSLRSPAPLEFPEFSGERVTDAQSKAGGIMIAKAAMNMVPAGGCVQGDGSTKVMVWKLGGDFLGMKGREWSKSF